MDAPNDLEKKILALLSEALASLEDQVDLAKWAGEACCSESNLRRVLRRMTGMPLGEIFRTVRLLEAAKALIETDDKVEDIGERAGYDTSQGFIRAFHEFFMCSPGDFRRRNRGSDLRLPSLTIEPDRYPATLTASSVTVAVAQDQRCTFNFRGIKRTDIVGQYQVEGRPVCLVSAEEPSISPAEAPHAVYTYGEPKKDKGDN